MNDFEELKSLLFGAEKKALESITERVQKPETRAVDVADVLPEAVRLSHRQGDLAATLQEPVGECIKESFRNEPKQYADALYPVIGPAIRKSIINALRSFAQQINDTVEQSLTAKGIKWRFEAWRAGVPFGDYVIQRTLMYRVEQAYLISRGNGLLIGHVHHEASRIKDSDAVSAMFTAIQDFIQESFSPDRSGRLETADMGEFTLWAVHGPHALLVCVIRGVPPRALRSDLSGILERIHFRYGDAIREYSGDTASMPGVEEEIADCLRFEAQKTGETQKGLSKTLIVLLVLLAAFAAYLIVQGWQTRQQQQALAATLENTPGLYVSEISRDGELFTVRGLRDPLAESLEAVAARSGVDAERVVGDLRSFQSLDPEIRIRRAESLLSAPQSVVVVRDDGRLLLSGSAPESWLEATRSLVERGAVGVPVDLEGVESSDRAELHARAAALARAEFFFDDGLDLRESELARLEEHAAKLARVADDASRLGIEYRIDVIGHTDASGSLALNNRIAAGRADVAVDALRDHGLGADSISRGVGIASGEFSTPSAALRRVSIEFRLGAADDVGPDSPE